MDWFLHWVTAGLSAAEAWLTDLPTFGDFISAPALLSAGGWAITSALAIQSLTARRRLFIPVCAAFFAITLLFGANQYRNNREATQALADVRGSKSFVEVDAALNPGPRFQLMAYNPNPDLPVYDVNISVFRLDGGKYTSVGGHSYSALNSQSVSTVPGVLIEYGTYYITIGTRFGLFNETLCLGDANGKSAETLVISSHGFEVLYKNQTPPVVSIAGCPKLG